MIFVSIIGSLSWVSASFQQRDRNSNVLLVLLLLFSSWSSPLRWQWFQIRQSLRNPVDDLRESWKNKILVSEIKTFALILGEANSRSNRGQLSSKPCSRFFIVKTFPGHQWKTHPVKFSNYEVRWDAWVPPGGLSGGGGQSGSWAQWGDPHRPLWRLISSSRYRRSYGRSHRRHCLQYLRV